MLPSRARRVPQHFAVPHSGLESRRAMEVPLINPNGATRPPILRTTHATCGYLGVLTAPLLQRSVRTSVARLLVRWGLRQETRRADGAIGLAIIASPRKAADDNNAHLTSLKSNDREQQPCVGCVT